MPQGQTPRERLILCGREAQPVWAAAGWSLLDDIQILFAGSKQEGSQFASRG